MMRWDYLKAVLGKFGFADEFFALIMRCICEPDFAVFVNDMPINWFKSRMGLRQGGSIITLLICAWR